MEICSLRANRGDYLSDVSKAIQKMHALQIVHGDIKDQNIMFSPSLGRYLLTDFGTVMQVREQPGEKTWTFFYGTLKFTIPEMRNLFANDIRKRDYVDLYFNDVYGAKVSFQNKLHEPSYEEFKPKL